MRPHANARLTLQGRLLLCRRVIDQGCSLRQAAEAAGVSECTARRWLARYRAEGEGGLRDRSSRPRRSPRRTAPERERAVLGLRRTGMTAAEIGLCLGMSARTCSRIVRRAGLGRLRVLEPQEPGARYERERPGELLHVDIKKLGRIERAGHRVTGRRSSRKRRQGWEFVHCAVDDATRLGYCESHPDERQETAVALLRRAVRWFSAQGIRIERVMSDG